MQPKFKVDTNNIKEFVPKVNVAEFVPKIDIAEFKPQIVVPEFKPQTNLPEFKPQTNLPEFKPQSKLQPTFKEFIPQPSLENNYDNYEKTQNNEIIQEYLDDLTSNEFIPQPKQPAIWNVAQEMLHPPFIPSTLPTVSNIFEYDDQTQAIWDSQQEAVSGIATITISNNLEIPLTCLRKPMEHPYLTDSLRADLHEQNRLLNLRVLPEDPIFQELPESLHKNIYHSLVPLENPKSVSSDRLGYNSFLYKVTSKFDGYCYCLRRVLKCRLSVDAAVASCLSPWMSLNHSNIVSLRDCFASNQHDFSDQSISFCFVSDYYPGSLNFATKYFSSTTPVLSEQTLWSYFIQILTGLSAIHTSGLAYRLINPSNILLTSHYRVRLNNIGLADCLLGQPLNKSLKQAQGEDIENLALLMLQLGCVNIAATSKNKISASLEFLNSISPDLRKIVQLIMTHSSRAGNDPITVFDVSSIISYRLLLELQNSSKIADTFESEIFKEYHNGRISRILTKLNQIVDRPNLFGDRSWTDHPDRYMLKLFRDFVFFQVHEDGSPNTDFGHIIQSIDKLDNGSLEKIMLVGGGEKHIMIVSYFDVRTSLNSSYQMLSSHQTKSSNNDYIQLSTSSFMVVEKAKKVHKSNKNAFQSSRAPTLRDNHPNYSNRSLVGVNMNIHDQQHFIKQSNSSIQELQKLQLRPEVLNSVTQPQSLPLNHPRTQYGQPANFNQQFIGNPSHGNFNPNQQFVQSLPKVTNGQNYLVGHSMPIVHQNFQKPGLSSQFVPSQNPMINNVQQNVLSHGHQNSLQNPLTRMQVNNPNSQFFQAQFYGGAPH